MRLKKTFSFTDKNQVWRLLISDSDNLLIETRNTEGKEVYFHLVNLSKGKAYFKNFQLEEKFWVGIEAISEDKIYFHQFAKPNMPEHKKIICLDINNQEIIWKNDDLTFLSLQHEKVYAIKKKFEGQDTYILDANNGNVIEELGNDFIKVNEILNALKSKEDFSDYKYPEKYFGQYDESINNLIQNETKNKNTASIMECLIYNDFLFLSYYLKTTPNLLDNVFTVYNITKEKKVISEVINRNLNLFSPDSFFCYKNFLIVLKNKIEVAVYKIQ